MRYSNLINLNLQKSLNEIDHWSYKWWVVLNPTKSNSILFNIYYQYQYLPVKSNTLLLSEETNRLHKFGNFLGVFLDKKLQLDTYFYNIISKINFQTQPFNSTFHYVRCLFKYCPAALIIISPTKLKRLQHIRNQALKKAHKLPRYYPTNNLHKQCNARTVT